MAGTCPVAGFGRVVVLLPVRQPVGASQQAIWLLPKDEAYGIWPASGEIGAFGGAMDPSGCHFVSQQPCTLSLVPCRHHGVSRQRPWLPWWRCGVVRLNAALGFVPFAPCWRAIDASSPPWSRSFVLTGPFYPEDPYVMTHQTYSLPTGDLSEDFHIYGLIWNETRLQTYFDKQSNVVLDVRAAFMAVAWCCRCCCRCSRCSRCSRCCRHVGGIRVPTPVRGCVITQVDMSTYSFWERGGWNNSETLNNPWYGQGNNAPFDQVRQQRCGECHLLLTRALATLRRSSTSSSTSRLAARTRTSLTVRRGSRGPTTTPTRYMGVEFPFCLCGFPCRDALRRCCVPCR